MLHSSSKTSSLVTTLNAFRRERFLVVGAWGGIFLKILTTSLLFLCKEICVRYFHKGNLLIDASIMIEKPQ